MKQDQYNSTVWMRSDGPGVIVILGNAQAESAGIYHFNDAANAIDLFQRLIGDITRTNPVEDMDIPQQNYDQKLVSEIDNQLQLFCNGKESLSRMKKLQTYSGSVSYRDCDSDDRFLVDKNRKLGTIHVKRDCFKNTPPEYITVRISDSRPMNVDP